MNQIVELPPKLGAITSGGQVRAIVPQTLDDAYRLAKMIATSGLAPASFKTPESVVVAIMHGLEVGLPPMMALQSIAVINGRPTLWGDGAMAIVRATGQLEEFEERIDGAGEAMIAYCKIKRRGEKPVEHSFAVADAKKAGLWGKAGPWQTYPRRMLAMRPRSWCLRDVFADALRGLHIAEEVADTPMQDITPPRVPSPPPAPPTTPPAPPAAVTIDHAPAPDTGNSAADAYTLGEAAAMRDDDRSVPGEIMQLGNAEAWLGGYDSVIEDRQSDASGNR